MTEQRRARFASRLAGAMLLGAATILVPKADPTEHWATPIDILAAVEFEQAPDPDEPLPGGAVLLWPALLLRRAEAAVRRAVPHRWRPTRLVSRGRRHQRRPGPPRRSR